jgi:hypothetical protein
MDIEIPVAAMPSVAIPDYTQRSRAIGHEDGQPPHRLLIAEDQLENSLLLRNLPGTLGFDLREAVTGREAAAAFKHWRPRLNWMDIPTPVRKGS